MANRKILGAVAMTAALAAGGVAGATLGVPGISGAQSNPTTTTTAANTKSDGTKTDSQRPGRGGFGRGVELEAAATALGISTDDLQTELKAGKTIAEVATEKKVDKQKVIDAIVAAGEKRLDEAKAKLPEQAANLVDRKLPEGGEGPGRGFGMGVELEAAATALGISADDLRTELKDGKSIAEVATEKKVDKQKVIDALVAAAKTRLAEAVKNGKLTQAEADKRTETLTERITKAVDAKGGFGRGPGGHGRPGGDDAGASEGEDTGGN
jgi:uncharacterized protein (DUF433 family)